MQTVQFNFEATTIAGLYDMSDERAHEIAELATSVTTEIVDQHENYTFKEGDNAAVHRGKVLKRFLQIATNDNESAFIIHAAEHFTKTINSKISNKILKQSLKDFINEL